MPTYTFSDDDTLNANKEKGERLYRSLTQEKIPTGRNMGNVKQRNSFLRVYRLYLNLHVEFHSGDSIVDGHKVSIENYRTAVAQGLHGQPYHNLPDLKELFTGFVSEEANELLKRGKNPVNEHVYPRNRTLRLDLLEPIVPLSFKEFIYHYASKGGVFSKTTPEENRIVRAFHKQNPNALEELSWREIYSKCHIYEASN